MKKKKHTLISTSPQVGRRAFLDKGLRAAALLSLGTLSGYLVRQSMKDGMVWQIDPQKCTQCGRCASDCVLAVSAVKCVHVYQMCGYCDLCGGYLRPQAPLINTAAENQLCPTKAIRRTFVEAPYYKYDIEEDLCIGCGKCVEGCSAFGNGSFQLQIRHNLCKDCNQCSIASVCPSNAISRVPASRGYLLTGHK